MNNKIELTKIEEIKKLLDDCNINVENIGNKVKLIQFLQIHFEGRFSKKDRIRYL